jgi:CDP-glucose 4,6-dehydratase
VSSDGGVWRGKRVFLTGHTGFKGAWLTLWLEHLGARVIGYSLPPRPDSMFARLGLERLCDESRLADIRDRAALATALAAAEPDVVFHMAAQALVLESYEDPIGTIETNVVGTANVLEALRRLDRPVTTLVVTSDKCYENRGWIYSYREIDPLGGHDVYSASKAAAEVVTASYRCSFFESSGRIRVASARAGNVIGGGDRAAHRIVPDSVGALARGEAIVVRNPQHIRPWQHVLEPLGGYLLLTERILAGETDLCEAWNFAPRQDASRTVEDLVNAFIRSWGEGEWRSEDVGGGREAQTLRVSPEKAAVRLGWSPRWDFDVAVAKTAAWYRAEHDGATAGELRALSVRQIDEYGEARA